MSRIEGVEFASAVRQAYRNVRFSSRKTPEDNYALACTNIPAFSFYVEDVQYLIDTVATNPDFLQSGEGGIIISALANKVMNSTDTLYVTADLQNLEYDHQAGGYFYGAFLRKGTLVFREDSFSMLAMA
ncbi:MAG: hypothetical protein GY847_32820 [Proteobacteria bacterium]|nr:hypothetical protein [Pseudomonadota bacterium]